MIEFIDNQTIKFNQEGTTDSCGCVGKHYCQPVRFTDETQFQIKGSVVNSDPTFGDSYIGWETWIALLLTVDFTGVSDIGECDGQVDAIATLGSGSGYEYKIDDGVFQVSGTFTGLCEGTYLITAIDSDGHYASQYVTIGLQYDCANLAGKELSEMTDIELYELTNCELNDAL